MSPNSQKNLGKGRNGNNFANKDYSITRIIKEMLDKTCDIVGAEGRTWRQQIAYKIMYEAAFGNPTLIKELLERLEGKITLPIEGAIEITDETQLTDEQLAVIAAEEIIKNHASERSGGTSKEKEGP